MTINKKTIFIFSFFLFLCSPPIKTNIKKNNLNDLKLSLKIENTIPNYQEKVDAVYNYMVESIKNRGYDSNKLILSPDYIVKISYKNNYDIPLLLAQAHLETCFGFSNRAKRTNSVFAIGSHDNGYNTKIYKTQNQSIEDYIKIMNSHYLKNKKVKHLLNNFVNKNNKRYAANKQYENKIKTLRNNIINKYPILAKK